MIINIFLSIVFSFVIMIISSNVLGFFVRGLFPQKEMEQMNIEINEFENYSKKIKGINFLSLILIIAYLYALFHFWNIGISIIV